MLGPEGVGKTWLVGRWWTASSDQPILVIGGAYTANQIDPKESLKSLARLMVDPESGNLDREADRLLRRLQRWRDPPPTFSGTRFLVVLDGLNETSGKSWAETILKLSPEVRRLGGHLLVTCRERYWSREIAPRLAGVAVQSVPVSDYSEDELATVLRQHGRVIESVPERLRTFIRNPRICAVALDLLDRLAAQADELTIERLLLEYWRRRLEERGDLVAHSVRDFETLLKSHAKAFRESPGVQFDRDDWRDHCGAARRADGRSIENDSSDIEEGAFLRVVNDRDGFYEFKPDVVPFALGLLVAREVEGELRKPNRSATEVIDGIVEKVQGFDLVAEALRAAAGIACFDDRYPAPARASLLSAWLELQNVPDIGYDSLIAYAAARPTAILDAAEAALANRAGTRPEEWLLSALIDTRQRPRVAAALDQRIPTWLARWCRNPRQLGGRDEQEEKRLCNATARLSDKLASLTPGERKLLDRSCVEVADPEAAWLDATAALLMAGLPQARFAEGLLAWAFVDALVDDFRAEADLCWSVRLNLHDFESLEHEVRAHVDALLAEPFSNTGRRAASIVLRVLGTVAAAEKAEQLSPRQHWTPLRRVERYCATDPFDPNSARPDNIVNAVTEASTIEPTDAWAQMSPGGRDHELEFITPGLARFEPNAIVPVLRAIASSAVSRSDISLRQLSWHLPRLSPLFDQATFDAVGSAYARVVSEWDLVAEADRSHVPGSLLLSLLPHLEVAEQLNLYLRLPATVADWYAFREVIKPLTPVALEEALIRADNDALRLRRVLFFASAHGVKLTDVARTVLGRALEHPDPGVVTCASELAYGARDDALNDCVIGAARRRAEPEEAQDEAFWRARAVAAAVVSSRKIEDASLIAPRVFGFAATQFDGRLDHHLRALLDSAITRLLSPVRTEEPLLGRMVVEVGRPGRDPSQRIDDHADMDRENGIDALRKLASEMVGPRQGIDEFALRQEALRSEADTFLKSLSQERARPLAREPDLNALARMAAIDPETTKAWADRILVETDRSRLVWICNLALGLASALAATDPECSEALLAHLADVRSPVGIVYGAARVPLEIQALFSASEAKALVERRARALATALCDAELEMLVFAAEKSGHADWLSGWAEEEVRAGSPGRVARALTVAGLRSDRVETAALLARNWGTGFLGYVAERARLNRERDLWARHWAEQMVTASDPVDFWRGGELMVGIADLRALRCFDTPIDTLLMQRFGREFFERVLKSAERRTNKRRGTLFFMKKPDRHLFMVLKSARLEKYV